MFNWTSKDLNSEQDAAIKIDGNVFLTACPGSGKTRTLIYKIAFELSKLKSPREFVVAITYTNRAADEIHERVEHLGVDTSQLWIGTIHSFCIEWILKPYGIYHEKLRRGFRVINSHDSEKLLTDLCNTHKSKGIKFWDCSYFYTQEGRVIGCPYEWKHENLNFILDLYYETLSTNRQIDFELILFYSYELIKENPAICTLLSNLFKYILIDEYQDTREIQYTIITSILKAGKGNTKTFVVGDPNQAIYESLGGFPISPEAFKSMSEIELDELSLTQNYRSSDRIIKYFNHFNFYATRIDPASNDKDYPSLITYNNKVHKDGLTSEIIRLIQFNIEEMRIPAERICILAPWWIHLASMTRSLVISLPNYQFDGPGTVPFARDLDNFWYKLSKIVLTEPSPTMFIRRYRWAGDVLNDLKSAGVDTSRIDRRTLLKVSNSIQVDAQNGLEFLEKYFDAISEILRWEYKTNPYLLEHHEAFFSSSRSRIARLKKEGADFIEDINAFKNVFKPRSGITVSTIHGVKGSEFDTVIAYGLLDGMVPNFNDSNPDESAMKLLYVLSSRAKKNLHLISETGRVDGRSKEYSPTSMLANLSYSYHDLE